MQRDHFLYALIGLLVGFISGYILHEVMAARQPLRQVVGAPPVPGAVQPGAGGNGRGAMGQPPAAAADPQAAMQQVQELRAYVEANPEDSEALLLLANMNYDIQNWQRAIDLYGRYLQLKPEDVDVMTDQGVAYRAVGEFDKALEMFALATDKAPDHWQARFNRVVVLAFDMGQPELAQETMGELLQLAPDNPDVNRLAAELRKRLEGA